MKSSFLISAFIFPKSYLLTSNQTVVLLLLFLIILFLLLYFIIFMFYLLLLLLFLLSMEAKDLPLFKQGAYVINLAENWERALVSRTIILSLEQCYS